MENWRRSLHATWAVFFIGGFCIATWAPLIPFVKQRLGIGDDVLGMLILCIGIGALCIMPFAGTLASRFGCRKVLRCDAVFLCVMLWLLSQVSTLPMAITELLIFGACFGTFDVVINIHAIEVERMAGRHVLSATHGMWCVGQFVSVLLFGLWMTLGITLNTAVALQLAFILTLDAVFSRNLLAAGGVSGGSSFAPPRGVVTFIGLIACLGFLVEGGIMDWGALFLHTHKGFAMESASSGFTFFTASMLIFRLSGDNLVLRYGGEKVVLTGCVFSFLGFLLILFCEAHPLLYAGFFLVGVGVANIIPIFYSLVGRQKIMPVAPAVSAVSTLGYFGMLGGPTTLGILAQQTSLYFSLGFLAILVLILMALAKYVFKTVL